MFHRFLLRVRCSAMKQLFAKPKKTQSILSSPTNQRSLFAVRQPFDLPTDDPIEVRASQSRRKVRVGDAFVSLR